jgi:hypothetical protein
MNRDSYRYRRNCFILVSHTGNPIWLPLDVIGVVRFDHPAYYLPLVFTFAQLPFFPDFEATLLSCHMKSFHARQNPQKSDANIINCSTIVLPHLCKLSDPQIDTCTYPYPFAR